MKLRITIEQSEYLDSSIPQLGAECHSMLHQVFLSRGYVDLCLYRSDLALSFSLALFQHGHYSFNSDGNTHARNLLGLAIEQGHQVIIATTTGYRAYSFFRILP